MKMCFYPDIFERIHKSKCNLKLGMCELENCQLKKRKIMCELKKHKLSLVDSFTLYMLLQLHAKGKRFAEHRTTLDELRPIFSPTNDKRKDKDLIFFLDVLHSADMITYKLNEREVFYRFVPSVNVKISSRGNPRKFVLIRKCNRHIMKYYDSNVPFALYCLLRSLQRRDNGITYAVRISFKEICRRLNISIDTLHKSKLKLEEDGYIFTVRGWNPDESKCECNEYSLFDYDNKHAERKPEKFEIFQMRRQQQKSNKNLRKQKEQEANANIPEPTQENVNVFDWDI